MCFVCCSCRTQEIVCNFAVRLCLPPVVLFDLFFALAGIFLGGFLTSGLELKTVGFELNEMMSFVKIENNLKDLLGFSSFFFLSPSGLSSS